MDRGGWGLQSLESKSVSQNSDWTAGAAADVWSKMAAPQPSLGDGPWLEAPEELQTSARTWTNKTVFPLIPFWRSFTVFYSDSSSLNPILQNSFIQQRSTEYLICNEHS